LVVRQSVASRVPSLSVAAVMHSGETRAGFGGDGALAPTDIGGSLTMGKTKMDRSGEGLVDIDGDGVFDMQYGMKIDVQKGASLNPGGADGSKSMETPRPDGPQPTEQQINEGPYTGRHVGGWKMKRALLQPENNVEDGRHISMSHVHGTFFTEPKERWYEAHNNTHDTRPAEDFKQRLYPLERSLYSPWEPTEKDMTPMSRTIGSYAMKGANSQLNGAKGPNLAAVQPQRMGHIQGYEKPPSKGVPPKREVQAQGAISSLSDNPSWGKVREGHESAAKPDPSWGYTGHVFARRYDVGEEDLSMASRVARRRQQAIERRFSASPFAHQLAKDVLSLGDGVEPPKDLQAYGWAAFPPTGLGPKP